MVSNHFQQMAVHPLGINVLANPNQVHIRPGRQAIVLQDLLPQSGIIGQLVCKAIQRHDGLTPKIALSLYVTVAEQKKAEIRAVHFLKKDAMQFSDASCFLSFPPSIKEPHVGDS